MAEPTTTTLLNVRIFDGDKLLPPSTLTFSGALITSISPSTSSVVESASSNVIDCDLRILLPGFIDAHIHLNGIPSLYALLASGVTTALDMGCWPLSDLNPLRSLPGLPTIHSTGPPASSPIGMHSKHTHMPKELLLSSADQAAQFVADRIQEGSDYIKIITDVPGLDQATLNALVEASHAHGKICFAHAAKNVPYTMALEAGADVLTHVPLDTALSTATVTSMAAGHHIVVPTLAMMEAIVEKLPRAGLSYEPARASVIALHGAGVPILAGTDGNTSEGSPASVQYGESLHHELQLLVGAGLTNVEALRAATVLPAKLLGLDDRGEIKVGKRADLVLLEQDPLENIGATRSIVRVWCRGVLAKEVKR
ncbi:hypothetical protein MMC34_003872 [Xylographa carneopallida]|nr:hypothetical protein [Xylographa carneopallida]